MKNLLLLLFAFPLFTGAQSATQFFYLKAKEDNAAGILIDSTVKVLNNRLSKQGYSNTSVLYDNKKKQFVITAKDFIDTNYIKLLLIKPFKISLYELYSIEEIVNELAFVKRDKATYDTIHPFYRLLNISSQNFESLKRTSYVGMLELKDTSSFQLLKRQIAPYLPVDLVFAYPRKLSPIQPLIIEVYALKNNIFKLDMNKTLVEAKVGEDARGRTSIRLSFDKIGKKLFGEITKKNLNRAVAITIDNRVVTAPFVVGATEGGEIEINGDFTNNEAKEIVDMLLAGHLPLNLTFINQ